MEAFEKKTEVEKIRERNGKLVDNILPKHVADYFLQNQNKDETVIFPYFTVFYCVLFVPNANRKRINCTTIVSTFGNNRFPLIEEPPNCDGYHLCLLLDFCHRVTGAVQSVIQLRDSDICVDSKL